MRIEVHDTYKTIIPDEGKMLFDGKDTASEVSMPINADHSLWRDINIIADDEEISADEALEIITAR